MPAEKAPKRDTTRVQLELPKGAYDRLVALKDATEAVSYSEVVRTALKVYEESLTK